MADLKNGKDEVGRSTDVAIRWMVRRDLHQVLCIEGMTPQAWSEAHFRKIMKSRNCIGCVAISRDRPGISGFMVYDMQRGVLEILNFAVAERDRRTGVGRKMIDALKKKAMERKRSVCVVLRETNLTAQQFFRSQGFRAEAVSRAHYDDTGEDGYILAFSA